MDPVTVFKYELNSEFTNARVYRGEVEGVCVRLYTKDSSGKSMVLRELAVPDSVMNSHRWTQTSRPVGENE